MQIRDIKILLVYCHFIEYVLFVSSNHKSLFERGKFNKPLNNCSKLTAMQLMNLSSCKLLLFRLTGILHQQASMDFTRNQVTASLLINVAYTKFLSDFRNIVVWIFFILPRISKSFNLFCKTLRDSFKHSTNGRCKCLF